MKTSNKGVSLIITFFIMLIILGIVLDLATILSNKLKVIADIGNSVIASHVANVGLEQTLYYDRQQILPGAKRGLCNMCALCATGVDSNVSCNSCTPTPLNGDPNGCDTTSCANCQISYNLTFNNDGRRDDVIAKVTPNPGASQAYPYSDFYADSRGTYHGVTKEIWLKATGICTGGWLSCFGGPDQPGHNECINAMCTYVMGPGGDQCASNNDCNPANHTECAGVTCELIYTPGPSTCSTVLDCGTSTHSACQGLSCNPIAPGKGPNQCTNNSQCSGGSCGGSGTLCTLPSQCCPGYTCAAGFCTPP